MHHQKPQGILYLFQNWKNEIIQRIYVYEIIQKIYVIY